jgi:hypothetical protein
VEGVSSVTMPAGCEKSLTIHKRCKVTGKPILPLGSCAHDYLNHSAGELNQNWRTCGNGSGGAYSKSPLSYIPQATFLLRT